jgi:hypothetical protein
MHIDGGAFLKGAARLFRLQTQSAAGLLRFGDAMRAVITNFAEWDNFAWDECAALRGEPIEE